MRFERAYLHGVLGFRWAAVVDGRRPRKALANTLRAWLANPATLPNDAPHRRHTQVIARKASPGARATSQVLDAEQLLFVPPSNRRRGQRHAVTSALNTTQSCYTRVIRTSNGWPTDGARKLQHFARSAQPQRKGGWRQTRANKQRKTRRAEEGPQVRLW